MFMLRRSAVLTAILAVVVTACGTTTPALTDPTEILTKSALALKDVKTMHLQVDLSGKVALDLTGTGSNSQLDLAGTTATLDIDVAGQKVKATGLAPALLNSGGEVIVADGAIYYKITGPFAQGTKYSKIPIPASPGFSPAPGTSLAASLNPQVAIDELNKALAKLPSAPTKLADEKCGDVDCYHVSIHLSAEDIAKLSSPRPLPSASTADVTIDVWTRKSDLRPARMSFGVNAGAQGTITVTITPTYDAPLSIAAPPADQVSEGSGLPFPIPSLGP
jgi:hypothetical protein